VKSESRASRGGYATGSRWRMTTMVNYSCAAMTFVVQRSTLFSVHPENSTRFPRMVTHIWYLSAKGIIIDISPDIHDARTLTLVREGKCIERMSPLPLTACLCLCQTHENTKKLTLNSLRGLSIFTFINRETQRIIISRIESESALKNMITAISHVNTL